MFKVKDLMIDVTSIELAKKTKDLGLCRFPTKWCGALLSRCPDNSLCLNRSVFCPTDTLRCPGVTDGCGLNYSTCLDSRFFLVDLEKLVINPDDINIVRDQMEQVLKAAEVRGTEVAENLRPQTMEQAEFLEQHLEAALDQIREMKDELG
jgi:hypothetical protein